MEHWEFLLQKDGDRSWLPLDSPSVEILEGRYRIVVRSSQANTEVGVRISHLNPAVDPPKRRIQKRSSRTNQDGLMVLIPFTRLEPGVWEFHCGSGDLMSELVGVPWQYSVQLQVLPQDVEMEEWEPDWSDSSGAGGGGQPQVSAAAEVVATPLAEPETQVIPVGSPQPSQESALQESALQEPASIERIPLVETPPELLSTLPPESLADSGEALIAPIASASIARPDPTAEEMRYLTEQLSDELINEVMQEFDLLNLPEPFLRSNSAAVNLLDDSPRQSNSAPATPAFSLKFAQEAWVARQSETLVLTGTIEIPQLDRAPSEVPDPWDSAGSLPQLKPQARSLQLYLRDPQSLEVLVSDHQPLPDAALAFNLSFNLPDQLTTRLLLGEVQLCGSTGESDPQILATQTFTITVNPLDLVQELTYLNTALNPPPPEVTEALQPLPEPTTLSLDLSFLASTEAAPSPTLSPKTQSLGGQPLPPQIYQPDPTQSRSPGLHLPDFSSALPPENPGIASPELELAVPAEVTTIAESSALPDPELEVAELVSAPQPEINAAPVPSPDLDAGGTEASPADALEQRMAEQGIPEASSPEVIPGETLAFRALNLHDRFLNRLNALAGEGEGTESAPDPAGAALTWINPASLSEASERMADEVVQDESSARTRSRGKLSQSPATKTDGEIANPLVLLPEEPVPTPDLQVTSGELVAGKPVHIRVRLPNLLPRIYVKLWINDRQTRSLLEGPRWLVDLLPNGHGFLEATTQLMVPLGSLDIRFEAIAVEMQTQRESRKVSVDRAVVPPDLPALSLHDLSD